MPRKRPREKIGTSQGHRDIWADLCGDSNSRGRLPVGQTGHMTGQTGHVYGTDETHTHTHTHTHTRGCPTKLLYVYWFFSFPM